MTNALTPSLFDATTRIAIIAGAAEAHALAARLIRSGAGVPVVFLPRPERVARRWDCP